MGTYIPHREGTVQSIVRLSLAIYQGYANPPEVIVNRLEQFAASPPLAAVMIISARRFEK